MRIHRLIAILVLMEARGQMKAKELAEALETSLRTIYRDIDILCEAGIPITATTGPQGGIRLMEGYSTHLYDLHSEDAVNLYLSGVGMYKGDTSLELKETLTKLERILPEEYQSDLKVARERFFFDETPWWGERPIPMCIETLRQFVWKLQKITISYCKVNSSVPSAEKVLPYGLVLKDMQWYLVALHERSHQVKSYKCERIINVEQSGETFDIPQDFDLEKYWTRSVQGFKRSRQQTENYPVLLKLEQSKASLLENLEVLEKREEDGCIQAWVNLHKFEFACNEITGILWDVEVLEPAELRYYVTKRIRDLVKIYLE